ncbi:hypothetical protein SAMN05216330_1102 [Bradyrhizobium sp. Ghvi]|uniref:hypothetical protein n=1 Tax=Bradyrhizobium sp. Ghvi TaxID=1855319 RepID=UPI0008EA2168|nr:hypothetical protein [Bradyrhizobium sp. Ghvi]SFP75120.1 hypothetical protein SAMN05216330_1102 [Bradyrhizobium sp. Ghvi]
MRRGAEAGLNTHELMGRSGHKSQAEVERYTKVANKKLADSGAEKKPPKGPKLITKQGRLRRPGIEAPCGIVRAS